MADSSVKNLASEFVGTFLLVLTVGCNVLSKNEAFGVLSIASVLMVCVYALGSVSGGHFNPAVTVAVFISEKVAGKETSVAGAGAYITTQLVAGVAAGQTYKFLFGAAFPVMPAGATLGTACAVEMFYTFMLCFVVLRCACSKKAEGNEYYGLAIGWVIVAGGYAGGWKSGGAFNPAVAVGIDVAAGTIKTGSIYFGVELIAAGIAAGAHIFFESEETSLLQKALSEFLGTFFLVLTVGLSVLGGSKAAALAIGASLMCMIYALGGVSGGHFNPAVTLALVFAKKFEGAGPIAAYMGAQFVGGFAAAGVYVLLAGKAVPLQPAAPHLITHAILAEVIYTFVLCSVVLHVAALSKGAAKHIFGLAIGSCIVVGGYAVGGVSGASLNPAVSFALDASNATKGGSFGNSAVYSVAEFVAATFAAGFFVLTRPSEFAGGAGTAEETKPLTAESAGAEA